MTTLDDIDLKLLARTQHGEIFARSEAQERRLGRMRAHGYVTKRMAPYESLSKAKATYRPVFGITNKGRSMLSSPKCDRPREACEGKGRSNDPKCGHDAASLLGCLTHEADRAMQPPPEAPPKPRVRPRGALPFLLTLMVLANTLVPTDGSEDFVDPFNPRSPR